MELKEAIKKHKAECNALGLGEDYCECGACNAFSLVLSAAEKAEEYMEKAEKWDAQEWWGNLSMKEKSNPIYVNESILSAYRKAQEGK